MRGECVAQRMHRQSVADDPQVFPHPPLNTAPRKTTAAPVQKERFPVRAAGMCGRLTPSEREIRAYRVNRVTADRHDPLAISLAENTHLPRRHVQVVNVQSVHLGETDPGTVDQFDQRKISDGEGTLRQRQKTSHFLFGKIGREAFLLFRKGYRRRRIRVNPFLAVTLPEKRFQRGERPGARRTGEPLVEQVGHIPPDVRRRQRPNVRLPIFILPDKEGEKTVHIDPVRSDRAGRETPRLKCRQKLFDRFTQKISPSVAAGPAAQPGVRGDSDLNPDF